MTDKDLMEATEQEKDREREVDRATSEFMARWAERRRAHLGLEETDVTGQTAFEENEEESVEESRAEEAFDENTSTKEESRPFQSLRQSLLNREVISTDADVNLIQEKPKRNPIPSDVVWKGIPIVFLSISMIILSLYFISPFSKSKQITVIGNQVLTQETVKEYSLIADADYIITTFLNKEAYAKNIELNSKMVKSAKINYQFPNQFIIAIEEYREIGYIKQNDTYYSVLSSGEISEIAVTSEQMPTQFTSINLQDKDLIKEFAVKLGKVDVSISSLIQSVDLTPSKVTSDLVTLTMSDGNKILVPISEIDQKLPYYPNIVNQLTQISTIDMEVGIYSYAS